MKTHKQIRIVAVILCVLMLMGIMPISAMAAWEDDNVIFSGEKFGTNGYYNVISKKDYVLVPGAAVESEMVINNASGTRRQVMHIIEVNPSSTDVSIVPGYYGIDKDLTKTENHKAAGVTECVEYYEDVLGYNVVGAMNTGLAYDCNAPYSWVVYNGEVLVDHKNGVNDFHDGYCQTMLCVYKNDDGSCYCELRTASQGLRGDEWQAIGANFGMVVNNGELVTKTEERTSDPAARSMIGVKEDGTLVLVMNDGRGANNSVGFCNYEEGEAMLALGCKWAFNCDGGGSSSFVTKRVGEDEAVMRCVPCDGAERATLNSVLIVSNVAPTGELEVVNVESDYDYFAPNTTYTFTAEAIDTHGYSMDMPADATWSLSNTSFGTIANGTFVSNGTKGSVDVQITSGGQVVGTKTITIADPTDFSLSATSTTLPYSTADKVRTITLPIIAKIGEANVYIDTNAVTVSLSNSAAGTLNGFKFTATSNTSVSGVDVTVKYGTTSLVYSIVYGKGSEVIYDFENGNKSGFAGFEEAKQWCIDNSVNNTVVGSDPHAGQYSSAASSTTFLATSENGGQVRNGKYSLAWKLDQTDAIFAEWTYNILYNIGDTIVLRDVANGKLATTLGMWLYIPEGAAGIAFQSQLYTKNSDGSFTHWQDHYTFETVDGTRKTLNACSEADIPESRWVYASLDLTKYDYVCTPVATYESNNRTPSFIRTYVKPNVPAELTFYIDDITLDYSSAVDDRTLPTISDTTYSTSDTAVKLENGTNINGNTIGFTAKVTDNSALDLTSGKIYIDGVAVKSTISGNTLYTEKDVTLLSGVHTVTFEIKDELGNLARVTRDFTVSGTADVTLTGHNDSEKPAEYDSIYYVDIDVADLTQVDKLVATLKLQNANKWETIGAVAASGFKATFAYNEISELLTVTVERTDASAISSEDTTLVSIPVRIWSFDGINHITGKAIDEKTQMTTKNRPTVYIQCEVASGQVIFTDNTTSSFGGNINVATNLVNTTSVVHFHDTELTMLSKPATTTASGYEYRTYCETCKSVVDWGTILEATGHHYQIVDGKFVCSDEGCGHVYESGTGIFEMNGNLYYSIAGKLVTGWQNVENGYCYAYTDTYKLAVGSATINGVAYDFGTNGVTAGAWLKDENGTKYSYGPGFYSCATAANPHANVVWATIDGKTYAFDRNGYRHENVSILVESNSPAKVYEFTAEGVLIGEYTSSDTGILVCNNATTYLKDGIPIQAGLVYEDGYYYYISSGYVAVTGSYNVTRTNGLLEVGTYNFDDNGRMINPPGTKNGVIDNCLYINGELQKAYQLVEYDGNYYFINNGKNEIARSVKLYLSEQFVSGKTFADGTPIAVGFYEFDADGKMVIKNGIIDNCIYINGVLQKAYQLVEFEGNYYFINNGKNEIARNIKLYLSEQFVSGKVFADGTAIAAGFYEFDADGKMVIKNGIIDNCIYINGVLQKAYQLVEFEGNYYFINNGKNEIARNIKLYLSEQFVSGKTFADGTAIPSGFYEFDADGKMVIKHGIIDNCIYINGALQKAYQLVEFDGNYYFINNGKNEIARNTKLYLNEQFVSGKTFADGTAIATGFYDFDADGKMLVLNGPNADGFFYINGVKQLAYQLIKYQGNYYFINDYNKYAKDKMLYLNDGFVEETGLNPWYYTFDTEGKMVGYIDGLYNGRDIGGVYYYKTTDGQDVKSGLLIRGSEVDGAVSYSQPDGITYLQGEFGVKTEIDLRGNIENSSNELVTSGSHLYFDMVYYDEIFTDEGKAVVGQIFNVLCEEENYPIYMHCTHGIDRTGTVSYVLGAVLGISESDLCREYMLSHGAYGGDILKVQNGLHEKYDGSIQKERTEAYLLDCGVTEAQIAALREIYLED